MSSSTHVPNQLHGYSLQFTECLSVLIDAEAGSHVSVEVLDDVALHSEGSKSDLVQTKAGFGTANPIADGSVELWKTIRNWIDQLNKKEINAKKTTFTLYTGAPRKGTLCLLMSAATSTSDVSEAIAKIEGKFITPRTRKLRANLGAEVKKQLEVVLEPKNRKHLEAIISKFTYRQGSDSSEEDLRSKFAKMAIQPNLVELVLRQMAGWVKLTIDGLIEQEKQPIISVAEFRKELTSFHVRLVQQPFLDWLANEAPAEEIADHVSRNYYRQLALIEVEQTELMKAVTDYLAAVAIAVRYQRAGIINRTSLDQYGRELHTLWGNLKKRLELSGNTKGEVHFGQTLLNDCYLQKTSLQGNDVSTSFMCGSFHALADEFKIGWHPRFLEILGGADGSF